MNTDRWERVKALFQAALERPAEERAAFLAAECKGDASLQAEVERLLQSHEQAGSFIEEPAVRGVRGGATETEAPATNPRSTEPGEQGSSSQGARRANAPKIFAPGDVVAGRYKVVRYIDQGAMGEVYEVQDLEIQGQVALKTIRREIAQNSKAVSRFKREIQMARKVTHPNVCRIYDFAAHHAPLAQGATVAGDILFLTMELLAGETLSERIAAAGRLTTGEAMTLTAQMAAGLHAAHAAGVLHRDFKSGNVMLARDSGGQTRAVITDFGMARGVAPTDSLASITEEGAMLGTPLYMAPEQVKGAELTPAADIYALGVVMYEMVTGERPFEGGGPITVVTRKLSAPPPTPRLVVPGLDLCWESVILRCLAREPSERFASAMDVVAALGGGAAAPSGGPPPVQTPTTGRVVMGASPTHLRTSRKRYMAWAAGTLLAVWGGYYAWRARPAMTPVIVVPTGAPAAVAVRRALAVLKIKNVSERADAAWLSTALSEMLTTDLAAGGKLRVIPGQEVARAKSELGIADVESVTKELGPKLKQNLGADLVVLGSYTIVGGEQGGFLRIDLRLFNTADAELLAMSTATGTEVQLFDLVSRAGAKLREALGLGAVSPGDALHVEASLPTSGEAGQLYSEGLARLRVSDALGAREALEKAVASEPKHPLPHAALAAAWSALGYDGKAREEAQKAAALSATLAPEAKLAVEARSHETSKDWGKAIETYRALVAMSPDDLDYGIRLAEAQISGGRSKEALVTVEALRKLPAPLSDDPRIDIAAARAFQELGDFRQQQHLASQAARNASSRGARLLVARARLLEATAQDALGEPERAAATIDEARRLFEAAGDRAGVARTLERMALGLDDRGDLGGARRIYERALAIYREIGDQSSTARVESNIATNLMQQGRTAEAQKLYEESLSTFRQIGARYEEAATLNDIGARLHSAGDLLGAQKRYEEALAIFGQIGERSGVATTLTNFAEVLFARGDLAQAQQMHEESLAINRETGYRSAAAYDLYRLGEVFAAKGDLRVARSRYEEALSIQSDLKETIAAAHTRLGLAALEVASGRALEGEAQAHEAEEVLRVENAADFQALAQVILAEALLVQDKVADAQKASDTATKLLSKSEDRHVRLAAAITAARVRAASGEAPEVATALRALEQTRAEAAKAGFLKDEYEAALALGTLEFASGRATAGKARLEALIKDAEGKGFGLIALRAQRTLSSS